MVFSPADLNRCFWWIWAPLIWPQIVGFDGTGALLTLSKKWKQEDILLAWRFSNMPVMATVLLYETLGYPPSWRTGLWEKERVHIFMVAREWINRMIVNVGGDAFSFQSNQDASVLHMLTLDSLTGSSISIDDKTLDDLDSKFSSIRNYRAPMEEKFSPIIRLRSIETSKVANGNEEKALLDQIQEHGIAKEYEEYKHSPATILPLSDDDFYCPRCGGRLTIIAENNLKQGHLVLCTTSRDAWIYLRPLLPDQIFVGN